MLLNTVRLLIENIETVSILWILQRCTKYLFGEERLYWVSELYAQFENSVL